MKVSWIGIKLFFKPYLLRCVLCTVRCTSTFKMSPKTVRNVFRIVKTSYQICSIFTVAFIIPRFSEVSYILPDKTIMKLNRKETETGMKQP